jgi:hypothetical protein
MARTGRPRQRPAESAPPHGPADRAHRRHAHPRLAGGQFTPVETEPAAGALDQAANTLVREFGLLIADVADAIADRRVTPDETQDLRAKWNGLRKRAETFVRRCEQGDYGDGK